MQFVRDAETGQPVNPPRVSGFRPLYDRPGRGGILPAAAKEKPFEGDVVAVGDKVLFTRFGGTEILVEGEPCLVLGEGEILGVVADEGGAA